MYLFLVDRNIASDLNFMDYRLYPYSSAKQYDDDALSKGSKKCGVYETYNEIIIFRSLPFKVFSGLFHD